MAIISASYKTDIPAFYADWFLARLDAGAVQMVNPWNGNIKDVALTPADVEGFVFWTRNPEPFCSGLRRVAALWPFVVQFTILGYPRAIDRSVVSEDQAVKTFRNLAVDFGARAIVWRYDPIIMTSLTDTKWHLENFRRLSRRLEGATDEVVVSFVQAYRKTSRNVAKAAAAASIFLATAADR